jgi:hypothetical protein
MLFSSLSVLPIHPLGISMPVFTMIYKLFSLILLSSLLGSCLGSESDPGGEVAGLSLPDGMDLVTVAGDTNGSAVAAATNLNFSSQSDFRTDPARVRVWDEAVEPLEIINSILKSLGQTCAPKLVNQGPYIALVEMEDEGESSGGTGQSSGGDSVEYEAWIVDSTRSSNNSPANVQVWIEGEEEFGQGQVMQSTIYAHSEITAEPGAEDPFGQFSLDFAMVNQANDRIFQRGTLATTETTNGLAGFTFQVDAPTQYGGDTQINVLTTPDRTTGRARIRTTDWGTGDTFQYLVAFNQNYFARQRGSQVELFDRDRFRKNVWSYNLYWAADGNGHTAGQRVELESGFPFTYRSNGNTMYGHVGYWGIWSPEPGLPVSGATIQRETDDGIVEYSVRRAPGRLIHVQRIDLGLAELDGESLEWWDWNTGTQYLVSYTHDELDGIGDFHKTATWNQMTSSWEDLGAPELIVINAGEWYGFWSRTLGGNVQYVGGELSAKIFTQTFVSGDDSIFNGAESLTLYGVTQCLKAGMFAAEVEAGDVYLPEVAFDAAYEFSFERSTRTLRYGGPRVGLLSGEVPASGPFVWGMRTGPLTTEDPDTLGLVNSWDIWNLADYYVYETGANEWNQYALVLDEAGDAVQFDAPLQFLYTHETANDANADPAFDGLATMLDYGGPGMLWGIPHEEVDLDGDLQPDRWLPLFSLADGTILGPNGEYVAKAIDSELNMLESASPMPSALQALLNQAAGMILPNLSSWTNPVTATIPSDLGEPRVVGGVLVE